MRPEPRAPREPRWRGSGGARIRNGLATLARVSKRGGRAGPERAERFRGLVEGVVDGRLTGWAFDPNSPFERVVVSMLDPDRGRVTAVADRYRADLHLAGYGDGHVGFAIPLRGGTPAGIVAGPDDERLPDSPIEPASTADVPELRVGTVVLRLDPPHLSGRRVSGWAVDSRDPFRPLRLGLAAQGRMLNETRASRFRPDRAGAFCGFVLDHPGDERELALIHLPDGMRLAALP